MNSLTNLCALLGYLAVVAQAATPLVPKAYLSLPLGAIKPAGWLHDQLMVQTNGLAGHEHEFFPYVSETDWVGGPSFYSNLEEAGSYWFNAMVPNAWLADSPVLKAKTQAFLDYVISTQDSTGWLGPEVNTTKPRYLWGRYPFFFGAIQLLEVDPSQTTKVVTAMHKFVTLANTMLKSNETGVDAWAYTRWEDFVMTLEWLYEFHPNGTESTLLETMQLIKAQGMPWKDVFAPAAFPTGPVEHIDNPFGDYGLSWHGVNMAEGLKSASAYRFTHDKTDLDAISTGWDLLFQYHGRPSGIYAADEYLAGLGATRGTELCLVVETMFSGSYLYQLSGDIKFADRVERIAYNALPATLTGDMWSHQYLQQQNQIASRDMTPNPFALDGSYSNVFGLEPNYPCCTVNHPQGWPKFITNSFVVPSSNPNSLVHLYLGPFSTQTTLANGNKVTVSVDTQYPFSDVVKTTITASKAFTYQVRIPVWVTAGTIAINGGAAKAVTPTNGLQTIAAKAGKTSFVLNLPAPITVEARLNGSVAIHRGPLHYAFQISHNDTILRQDPNESRSVDIQMLATSSWAFAIDPKKLTFHPSKGTAPLASPIYTDAQAPPLSITAVACPIAWGEAGVTFADDPPVSPSCTGPATTITLLPYGATKLRIGEFPTFTS